MENYNIGGRLYTVSEPWLQDIVLLDKENYIFELDHLSVIKVSGKAAAEFLQGQLTCDIRLINQHQMQFGALCNVKGRILALLDVIFWNNEFFLILPKDLAQAVVCKLEKVALLARVTCELLNNLVIYGLCIDHAAANVMHKIILPEILQGVTATATTYCYAMAKGMYIVIAQDNHTAIVKPQGAVHKRSLAWHLLELQAHRYTIYPITSGAFLPHRLNLHNMGYISFTKGCYKGQEIIARMHYRSNLDNYKCNVVTLNINHNPSIGEKLLLDANQKHAGLVVDYCPTHIPDNYVVALSY